MIAATMTDRATPASTGVHVTCTWDLRGGDAVRLEIDDGTGLDRWGATDGATPFSGLGTGALMGTVEGEGYVAWSIDTPGGERVLALRGDLDPLLLMVLATLLRADASVSTDP